MAKITGASAFYQKHFFDHAEVTEVPLGSRTKAIFTLKGLEIPDGEYKFNGFKKTDPILESPDGRLVSFRAEGEAFLVDRRRVGDRRKKTSASST